MLPLRREIEVTAVPGEAEDVALRLGPVLPRAITCVPDRMELHPVFLERHSVVAADPVVPNVGCRHLFVGILAEGIGVRLDFSAPERHLLPLAPVAPAILVVDRNARGILYRVGTA